MPAPEGAGEVAGIGKTKQIGNFSDREMALFHIACGKALPGAVESVLECGVLLCQFELQVAGAHMHLLCDSLFAQRAGSQLLDNEPAYPVNHILALHFFQILHNNLVMVLGHVGTAPRDLPIH